MAPSPVWLAVASVAAALSDVTPEQRAECARLDARFDAAVARAGREHVARVWHDARVEDHCKDIKRNSWRQPGTRFNVIGLPCQPWWRQDAIAIVDALAEDTMTGVEWGGGSSSYWLAKRLKFLHVIENSKEFGAMLKRGISETIEHGAEKIALHVVDMGDCPHYDCKDRVKAMGYVKAPLVRPDGTADNVVDLAIDDGRFRFYVMRRALELLKPSGGILVLDNTGQGQYKRAVDLVPKHWRRFASVEPWPDDGTLSREDTMAANKYIRRDKLQTTVFLSRPAYCPPRPVDSIGAPGSGLERTKTGKLVTWAERGYDAALGRPTQ